MDKQRIYDRVDSIVDEMDDKEMQVFERALDKALRDLAEAALKERGCFRCGGEVQDDSYRNEVHLVGPCSVGSMETCSILCFDCHKKVAGFLSGNEFD